MQAAADSPFLENAIGAAGAVLIILTLPKSALLLEGGQRPTEALNDPEKYALRAAVQVRRRGQPWLRHRLRQPLTHTLLTPSRVPHQQVNVASVHLLQHTVKP